MAGNTSRGRNVRITRFRQNQFCLISDIDNTTLDRPRLHVGYYTIRIVRQFQGIGAGDYYCGCFDGLDIFEYCFHPRIPALTINHAHQQMYDYIQRNELEQTIPNEILWDIISEDEHADDMEFASIKLLMELNK